MSRRESRSSPGARQNDTLLEFENFKKKFLLANKHITKLNSTLSLRIEELNAQISLLYVENLRLRESEIALAAQLNKERDMLRIVLADAQTTAQNLAKHLMYRGEAHNLRTVGTPPPTLPFLRDRHQVFGGSSPISSKFNRISRPPNMPGIYEEKKSSESTDKVEKRTAPPQRKVKSKPRPPVSDLPRPNSSPTPTTNDTISTSSSIRKTIRRRSGVLGVSTVAVSVPRPGSPAFGSSIRLQAGRAEEAEEIAVARDKLEGIATNTADLLAQKETLRGKVTEDIEAEVGSKRRGKTRLREEADTMEIPKPKLSDLGAIDEEDSQDEINPMGGRDSENLEDIVADDLEAMNKLIVMDTPFDTSVDEHLDNLLPPESGERSFSVSLSSITTEDLTDFIVRDSEYPAHGGGYADVYTGNLSKEEYQTKAAIKVIRAHVYTSNNQWKIQKRLSREIRLWSCLRHPNVVPLLGTTTSFGSHTAMVCPWMDEGNLHHYLNDRKTDLNLRRRLQILADIVEGLSYLHSQPVVHGDLTTGNVLMHDGKAHLSDFGLSNVMAEVRNSSFMSSTVGGAPRWTAPELLHVGADVSAVPDMTKQCDIYSLGSVILQVISGRIPYEDVLSEVQVILQMISGSDPPRPPEPLLSDDFWDLIVLCWSRDPFTRPEIDQVKEMLQVLRYGCSEEILAANVVDYDKSSEKDAVENAK